MRDIQVLQRILHLQKKHTDKTKEKIKVTDLWLASRSDVT